MIRPLRVALILAGLAAVSPAVSSAQSPPTAEQYQDALNQLKAAQDRKNELATENQKLRQQIADGEKKSTEQADKLTALESRAYFFRAHYAAWQQFIDLNPAIRTMWMTFFTDTSAAERMRDVLGDGSWPFTIDG